MDSHTPKGAQAARVGCEGFCFVFFFLMRIQSLVVMELGIDLGKAWAWDRHTQNTITEIQKLTKYIKTTTKYNNNSIVSTPGKLAVYCLLTLFLVPERELRLCFQSSMGNVGDTRTDEGWLWLHFVVPPPIHSGLFGCWAFPWDLDHVFIPQNHRHWCPKDTAA